MKQKDIALIVVVCFISMIASWFLSNALFSVKAADQQAEKVEAISSTFTKPDSKYFNKDAIDPTTLIEIGNSTNTAPFTGSAN
jgi:ABC-type phosphate/phosphonate transport system permease subunit